MTFEKQLSEATGERFWEEEEEIIEMDIPETPVMISKQGEVVCIEKSRDEPTVGFVGKKRIGKTLSLHGLCDRTFFIIKTPQFLSQMIPQMKHLLGVNQIELRTK